MAWLKLGEDEPARQFQRLWQMTPKQVVDELFENDAVKTLVLSQMTIPRGVGMDYPGGGIEVFENDRRRRKAGACARRFPFHRPGLAARLCP